MPRDIERIRQAIRSQRYRISAHANDEMADDALESQDIEAIIVTGMIADRFTHDPRGTRYEVAGTTTDGRSTEVANLAQYTHTTSPLKAKCRCGCLFAVPDVVLEARPFYRKRTRLPGS
jgi:hypothetical protein